MQLLAEEGLLAPVIVCELLVNACTRCVVFAAFLQLQFDLHWVYLPRLWVLPPAALSLTSDDSFVLEHLVILNFTYIGKHAPISLRPF